MTLEPNATETAAAQTLIDLALNEDLMGGRDVTTEALVEPDEKATVAVVAREAGIVAGLWIMPLVFARIDRNVTVRTQTRDSAAVTAGTTVATIAGPLRALLTGERTALNFVQHLCGVATLTRRYVAQAAGTRAGIFDTRKTLPGWRHLEKYAVRAGGGHNHRLGLHDQILIKDNHLAGWTAASAGHTIPQAIARSRAAFPGIPVEIEVDTLQQLEEALAAKPEMILLDNMNCAQMRRAVERRNELAPAVELEASGGISLETVAEVARTGVERISIGRLTHSAPAFDLAFDWASSR